MKAGHLLLALALLLLVAALAVLAWRKRQQRLQREAEQAAHEARIAESMAKLRGAVSEMRARIANDGVPVISRHGAPVIVRRSVAAAPAAAAHTLDTTAPRWAPDIVSVWPIDHPKPHYVSGGGGNFAGAGASGDWSSDTSSNSCTPASSSSDSGSTSSTD